jgi:hypothetical protein
MEGIVFPFCEFVFYTLFSGTGIGGKNMRDSGLCLDIMWALDFPTMCFLYKPFGGTMFFLERLLVECYMHTNQSSIGQ